MMIFIFLCSTSPHFPLYHECFYCILSFSVTKKALDVFVWISWSLSAVFLPDVIFFHWSFLSVHDISYDLLRHHILVAYSFFCQPLEKVQHSQPYKTTDHVYDSIVVTLVFKETFVFCCIELIYLNISFDIALLFQFSVSHIAFESTIHISIWVVAVSTIIVLTELLFQTRERQITFNDM